MSAPREVRIAHTPDPDDAFMFWALAAGRVPTDGLRVVHVLEEIETLNRRAAEDPDPCEVTALSAHAYAFLRGRYLLLEAGASFGLGWGPVLVAARDYTDEELAAGPLAVPGERTTAALLARLRWPGATLLAVPFREVIPAVLDGRARAGLVIHEEQLTYARRGVRKLLDCGEWWAGATGGLPLPLGLDAVRRDLPADLRARLGRLLQESIRCALAHRAEALDYALRFGGGIARAGADRFVGMYVNELTVECGRSGRAALAELYRRAAAAGAIPEAFTPEFGG